MWPRSIAKSESGYDDNVKDPLLAGLLGGTLAGEQQKESKSILARVVKASFRHAGSVMGYFEFFVLCNESAVTVRFVAGLTSIQLAHLSRSSSTGWTADSEYLL